MLHRLLGGAESTAVKAARLRAELAAVELQAAQEKEDAPSGGDASGQRGWEPHSGRGRREGGLFDSFGDESEWGASDGLALLRADRSASPAEASEAGRLVRRAWRAVAGQRCDPGSIDGGMNGGLGSGESGGEGDAALLADYREAVRLREDIDYDPGLERRRAAAAAAGPDSDEVVNDLRRYIGLSN